MKLSQLIIATALCASFSSYAVPYNQSETLYNAFNEAISLKKVNINRNILTINADYEYDLSSKPYKEYDTVALIGSPENVESAMKELLGFGLAEKAVLIDHINEPNKMRIKRYKGLSTQSADDYSKSLLEMLD